MFCKATFENSLSECLDNGGVTLLHGIDGHSHRRVTDDIQSKVVGMLLEINDSVSRARLLQLSHKLIGVLVHNLVEVLQDVEVEGWGDHLAVFMPFTTITR